MVFKQSFPAAYIAITFVWLAISTCPITQSTQTSGFTVDLIHRDSPDSPFYDSSLTHSQRLANALKRSLNHLSHLKHRNGQRPFPLTDVTNIHGEYLMKYLIGTPPVPVLAIADTDHHNTWLQCQPCSECFNQSKPLFNPSKSSTYKNVRCKSPRCSGFQSIRTGCSKDKKRNCFYENKYEYEGHEFYTIGEVATETITLGSSDDSVISFPNISIGCGFKNKINFYKGGGSGVVGLGGGESSLIQQLGHSIEGKFSYCFVPLSKGTSVSSKIHFGANAMVTGHGVVSTPTVIPRVWPQYYLTLEAMTIGTHRMGMDAPSEDWNDGPEGTNIYLDSGNTLTFFPLGLYQQLVLALKTMVKLKQVPDPKRVLDLCFVTPKAITLPGKVTLNFKGANVELKSENLFMKVTENVQCLVVKKGATPIIGNWFQTNILVGYDLQKKTVSFKPMDCTQS